MMVKNYIITKWGWLNVPKISTRVTFYRKAAVTKIKAANRLALTATGEQALKDATKYAPKDQESLQNSGFANSTFSAQELSYILRWDEPYAKYLWNGDVMYGNPTSRTYGPEKISFTEALARQEWAKYAKEVHGSEWKQVYQRELREELKK